MHSFVAIINQHSKMADEDFVLEPETPLTATLDDVDEHSDTERAGDDEENDELVEFRANWQHQVPLLTH